MILLPPLAGVQAGLETRYRARSKLDLPSWFIVAVPSESYKDIQGIDV